MGGMSPADVVNEVMIAIYWPEQIGDIEEGSDMANIALKKWDECLKQLLRAAHWDFARMQLPMQLLADLTGNTPNVSTYVPYPWTYAYEYPVNCVKARFIPWNWQNPSLVVPPNNIQIPQTPLNTGIGNTFIGGRVVPARFLVTSDPNYPPQIGEVPWDVPGISPQGRTVILTNVRDATLVYTARMSYPSNWDPLFRSAFIAYLASEMAGAVWVKKDVKQGIQIRNENIAVLKGKVTEARAASGNEGLSNTSDIRTDWMDARRSGGPWAGGYWAGVGGAWGAGDPGVLGYGWDSLGVPGGAAF